MKRLSKQQESEREGLVRALRASGSILAGAVGKFNATLADAWAEVEEALGVYAAVVEAANDFRDRIVTAASDYQGERSEKWQEGEAGSAYVSWVGEWESEIEGVEVEKPDDLDEPEADAAADHLADLPGEPEPA
jgi:hypothetical protein